MLDVILGLLGFTVLLLNVDPPVFVGFVSIFIGLLAFLERRNLKVVYACREAIAQLQADQGQIIHILYHGAPLCNFTYKPPGSWPPEMRWVEAKKFDINYTGDDVCSGCKRSLMNGEQIP